MVAAAASQGEVDEHAFMHATEQFALAICQQFPHAHMLIGGKARRADDGTVSRSVVFRASRDSMESHLRATETALSTRMHFDATGQKKHQPVAAGFSVAGMPDAESPVDYGYTILEVHDVPMECMCIGFVPHLLASHPDYNRPGKPFAHVLAQYVKAVQLSCGKPGNFDSNTIIAIIAPPAHDRSLNMLPRAVRCSNGSFMSLGVKWDDTATVANPPAPSGPPPNASQGQEVQQAPASMDAGGAFVVASENVQDVQMEEAAVVAAQNPEDISVLEDPTRAHEESASQRMEQCLYWLEDNCEVELSGGEAQYASKEQQMQAVQHVREHSASEFFSPRFSASAPHVELQVLLTEALRYVFTQVGFQEARASPSTSAPPTQRKTGPKKGPKGPKQGSGIQGPTGPPRGASAQRQRSRSLSLARAAPASASAPASHHERAARAAQRGDPVPVPPRSGQGRVEGTQAAAGPSHTRGRPAHRSLSPANLSGIASQAASVRRSSRPSKPISGLFSPNWSPSSPQG
jgi:hypothetical protein